MASRPVVFSTLDTLGTVGRAEVEWHLVDADGRPAPGTVDGHPVVLPATRHTDADGRLEVDVTPNESIQPDNTYYLVRFDGRAWRYLLEVPAGEGPVDFAACQADVPVALGSLAIDRVKGEPHGLAELDAAGRLPAGRLPEGVATDAAVAAVDQRIDGLGPGDVGADPAGSADSVRDELAPDIAGRVERAGDTMAGPLDLAGHRLTGLPAPADDADAARKADVSAVSAASVAKSGDTMDGDLIVDGAELSLIDPVIGSGIITGGVVREVHSLLSNANYTQSVPPVDRAVHPGHRVNWKGTLSDGAGSYGPSYGYWELGEGFGPPGVWDLSGRLYWGANSSVISFPPITMADVLRVGNVPGQNRTLRPAWHFMVSRTIIADDGTVTLDANDVNTGGAALVDNQTWTTANGGTLDGATNDVWLTSLLSIPIVIGNSHVAGRVVVDVMDINTAPPIHPDAASIEAQMQTQLHVPGQDQVGGGTVDTQIGVRIPRLAYATTNIGVQNASSSVFTPATVEVADSSAVVPVDVTLAVLDNTSGGPETIAAPAAGQDGQRLTMLALGDDVTVGTITVPAGDTVDVTFHNGAWRPVRDPGAVPAVSDTGTLGVGRTLTPGITTIGLEFTGTGDSHPSIGLIRNNFPGVVVGGAVGFAAPDGSGYDVLFARRGAGDIRIGDGSLGPGRLRGLAVASGLDLSEAASVATAAGAYTHTLAANASTSGADVGRTILCTAGLTLTLGTVNTTLWPVGASCRVVQVGASAVTVAAGSYTLRAPNGAASTAQGQEGIVRRLSSTEWSINWL